MIDFFIFNERLGISVPSSTEKWEDYSIEERQQLLLEWEKIRGHIPDRITELEHVINHKQALLSDESNFQKSCQLNTEIADLASIINDLWLWYRTNQDVAKSHH